MKPKSPKPESISRHITSVLREDRVFPPRKAFAAQAREHEGGTVVLPATALRALTKANGQCRPASIMALWRSPDRLASDSKWNAAVKLIELEDEVIRPQARDVA